MSTLCAGGDCGRRGALARGLRVRPPVAGRLGRLYGGLVLFGVSVVLMVDARLGLDPWDVFHQGLARQSGLPFGLVVNAVAGAVLLLWIPLGQRPGIGTVSNVIVV